MSKSEKEQGNILLFDDFPETSKEVWKEEVEKRASFEDLIWYTEDGIDIEPLYTKEEAGDFPLGKETLPGEFPFVRGTGKKDNRWLITEEIKFAGAQDAIIAASAAVRGGADSLVFIPQTEIKPRTMKTLIKETNPLRISMNFAVREDPQKVSALFLSSCAGMGIDTRKLRGCLFFDPLSHLLARGSLVTPLGENLEKIKETIESLSDSAPGYAAFSVRSSTFKNSGATITQELAFTVAAAAEYLVMLKERGVSADKTCRHMVFCFSTGSSFFAEIAKLRAARVLWANIVEQFSPALPDSFRMRIHCHTSTFNKTIYDSHSNIMRTALEAIASVIGGTESLTVEPFDAHYRETGELSRRIARNIQILLRNESHLGTVTDPGGGSYHVEKLTRSISEKSLELFQEIERKGGYLECVRSGFIKNAVISSGKKTLNDISRRRKTLVGTNEFPNLTERMAEEIRKPLEGEKINSGDGAPEVFLESRAARDFEKIRLLSEKFAERTGEDPKIFLLHLSDSPQTSARAIFSMNFFGCGGFSVVDGAKSPGIEQGITAALGENPLGVVICGSDEDYQSFAVEAVKSLRSKQAEIKIAICGDMSEKLREVEEVDFIQADQDVCEVLRKYQQPSSENRTKP
ncbi:MAG: acyl-CoA mutase large subunit family protein [Candidatus Dadabacteria bacterium]|nr:acyl-CoA mutase large subunit family protein [Candidatus Dadabacteria bacterium]